MSTALVSDMADGPFFARLQSQYLHLEVRAGAQRRAGRSVLYKEVLNESFCVCTYGDVKLNRFCEPCWQQWELIRMAAVGQFREAYIADVPRSHLCIRPRPFVCITQHEN
jgi:hypothetical protein